MLLPHFLCRVDGFIVCADPLGNDRYYVHFHELLICDHLFARWQQTTTAHSSSVLPRFSKGQGVNFLKGHFQSDVR